VTFLHEGLHNYALMVVAMVSGGAVAYVSAKRVARGEVGDAPRERDGASLQFAVGLAGRHRAGALDPRLGVVEEAPGPLRGALGQLVGGSLAVVHRADGVNELLVVGALALADRLAGRRHGRLVEPVVVVVARVREPGRDGEARPVAGAVGLAVDDPSAEPRLVGRGVGGGRWTAREPAVVGVGHCPPLLRPVV
jgi:hypothetical protein